MFTYRRQPNYLVDVFLRLLPADQKEFFISYGKRQIKTFSITMVLWLFSWKELTERALFWEKFIQNIQRVILLMMPKLLF